MSELAERLRRELADDPNIGEVRMFGGHCFMLNGNMLVCSMKAGDLLVRVGPEGQANALKRPGTTIMEMGGRQMKGYVVVDAATLEDDALRRWIADATAFVGTLPPKA